MAADLAEISKYLLPEKIRIKGRFIPPFTIDLKNKSSDSLSVIDPRIQMSFLGGTLAFEYRATTGELNPINPDELKTPTWFDTAGKFWVIAGILILIIIGWKLLRRI